MFSLQNKKYVSLSYPQSPTWSVAPIIIVDISEVLLATPLTLAMLKQNTFLLYLLLLTAHQLKSFIKSVMKYEAFLYYPP